MAYTFGNFNATATATELGVVATGSSAQPAIKGTAGSGSNLPPVQGWSTNGNGVYGQTAAANYGALCGVNTGAFGYGVYATAPGGGGIAYMTNGSGTGVASLSGLYGVWGELIGGGRNAVAIYGVANGVGVAGLFENGDLVHVGSGTKSFLIDHPLDPANRYLQHACIESSDVKNIYDGVAVANPAGEVEVQLPAYFEALNHEFRYQLTAIGGAAPQLHVKEAIKNNRFVIAGAGPSQAISWQVTGNRHDPTSQLRPFQAEYDKDPADQGRFLCPQAFGASEDRVLRPRLNLSGGVASEPTT